MKPSEVLEKAKELISDPARWTQNSNARNRSGIYTEANSPEAVQWCVNGACGKIEDKHDVSHDTWMVMARFADFTGLPRPSVFNDRYSHAEVMEYMDKLIAFAKKEEETQSDA